MVNFVGETIALSVAVSWTITALCFEYAGKRTGALNLNIIRLAMAMVMLGVVLKVFTGDVAPWDAGMEAWMWLALSGLVGYVFGDFCLMNVYLVIGSRFGQLFMTLAPPAAAVTGFFFLGERMNVQALLGMLITLLGIGISIVGSESEKSGKLFAMKLSLPLKGVLLGVGAGVGQGVGLVLSKMGMDAYLRHVEVASDLERWMVPFEATQVRAMFGLVGFVLILLFRKSLKDFVYSLQNKKAIVAAAGGTFFGPFIGVSLSLMAVQYTSAGIASTLMALTPIMILLPSHLIFKEKITRKQVLGALLSVMGVALFFV